MLYSVITTINLPTNQVIELAKKHKKENLGKIIIIGDLKGPKEYALKGAQLISIGAQEELFQDFSSILPKNHYARKNIGYLFAIKEGASCIYETDDDNRPNEYWLPRQLKVKKAKKVAAKEGWVNIYKYFSKEHIWPRGLPLDQIKKGTFLLEDVNESVICPIQQGLVNNSPDVDAIWRLTLDRPFNFDKQAKDSVLVPKGVWSPFNTQSTWWWPIAYPLLYIPSYCSFRMCDIWKSFIAQRCLWELDSELVYHPPEVVQDRNPHNLNRDFEEEIPGYLYNDKIAKILEKIELSRGPDYVSENLKKCYRVLVKEEIFPKQELALVEAWCKEIDELGNGK
jgi:hypothetical protein